MVSIVVGSAKTKTLNRLGECYRQPGQHYRDFVRHGADLPGTESYHKACKVCISEGGEQRCGQLG